MNHKTELLILLSKLFLIGLQNVASINTDASRKPTTLGFKSTQKFIFNFGQIMQNYDSLIEDDQISQSMFNMTNLLGTFGSVWMMEKPRMEKMMSLFLVRQMRMKPECHWTHEDDQNWFQEFQNIKSRISVDESQDFDMFPLSEYKAQLNKSQLANYTLKIMENFERLSKAIILDSNRDFVVLRFATFLRERMIVRHEIFPLCHWNDDDRKRAVLGIDEIYYQFITDVTQEVKEKTGTSKEYKFFSEADRKWTQQFFSTFFEPFP